MPLPNLWPRLGLSRTETRGQAANSRDDAEWEWSARYCSCPARKPDDCDSGLKKIVHLEPVNRRLLQQLKPEEVEVDIVRAEATEKLEGTGVEESELDEMWSFVGKKSNPRWLWHAIDRRTGQVLAYAFGRRQDKVFLQLKKLLEPFGIRRYCTDGWGAYQRHLAPAVHEVGKRKTQRIERKHLMLRTRIKRLARKTICFSKSEVMHDLVVGLFINRYEFGLSV